MSLEQTLLENAATMGVQAARSFFSVELEKARLRMERCTTEELGQIQGEVRLARKFLKIFGAQDVVS